VKSIVAQDQACIYSIMMDITEHKQAEEAQKQYHDQLEALVEARTLELKQINEQLLNEIAERKQTAETLQRRNRELELLNRAGQVFSSSLDLDRVLAAIMEEVQSLLNIVGCSIWLTDPETDELVCRQATGLQNELIRNWRLKPGEGIAGWVASNNQSLIVPDTQIDTRHFGDVDRQAGLEIRSIASVPLRLKERVIGALQVVDSAVSRFNESDLKLVEALAPAAAIAIENARLYTEGRQAEIELQNRNEELDSFAHTVAHDLKNPLGVIVGIAEILTVDYNNLPTTDLKNYLNTIAQSGRKARNIVEELLLLASVRQKEVKLKPLDMADIVAEAQRRLTDLIRRNQAEIHLPGDWPDALGYAPWVEEIWVNYLSNAIKYGGQPPLVELGATVQEDQTVHFWVKDNGSGLTLEDQLRLFTPFTQLNQVRATGHGLGLSIVRRIVEKLDGQVTVKSELGQGSIFGFILPSAISSPDEARLS
jgi:signal transduction histidine kinase